jgi:hypothetical protein
MTEFEMEPDFANYVYVSTLDKMGFKLEEKYTEISDNGRTHTFKSRIIDKNFFDNIDPTRFVESSVGHGKEEVLDKNIRSSKIIKKINVNIKSLYECSGNNLNPKRIKPISHSLECKFSNNIDLIKYEEGDHFNEFHYDMFKKDNIATVLIFPPCNTSDLLGSISNIERNTLTRFKGGDLIFKLGEKTFILKTSEFSDKDYTVVIFSDILHKCEPIISGIRYVFKTTISSEMPKILSDDMKFKLSDIEKYKCNIENIENNIYDNEYKIKDDLHNICILPDYIENNINDINNYDKYIAKYIMKMIQKGYNVVPLYMKFEFKTDYEEGWRQMYGSSPINIDFYDDYPVYYNLQYQERWILNGKELDYHSEYNDQSGDDIYEEYECSCLLIWK